ncbi:hypothetical protein B4113_1472 [Geobacillus sp. B4113_201601]|nr:hypothetical protein B4113_1472 [Geobacillus sp. B4113_201601]
MLAYVSLFRVFVFPPSLVPSLFIDRLLIFILDEFFRFYA